MPTPEAWWSIVLGSGYRGTVEELAPDARERVRRANIDFPRKQSVVAVEANVVYAVATRSE